MRKALVILCVLALAFPTWAAWTVNGNNVITVSLTIPGETWIQFQDDTWGTATSPEPDIVFGTGDYHNTTLIGTYASGYTPISTDPYGTGYYESLDGATIYMKSNQDLTETIAVSGPLTSGTHTLPSWFTVAVTGYDETAGAPDPNGFRLGSSQSGTGWVADGIIPGATMGGYGGHLLGGGGGTGSSQGPGPIYFGGQPFWGVQDAFQLISGNYTMDLDAPVGPGTMKFLGRVLRSGMADVAGAYTATMTISFVTP
jgi:hypothetical protein